MQKVLSMSTDGETMRARAVGWSCEDGDVVMKSVKDHNENLSNLFVGMIGGPKFWFCYPTPLHAIGDGWALLAPPREYKDIRYKELTDEKEEVTLYDWWFVRD